MPSRQRALLLVHPYFRPDRKKVRSRTEKDVWLSLKRLNYDVRISTAQGDLRELERDLVSSRPSFVFNLLEEFRDEGVYDFHAVSFLEGLSVPVTGCNPRGLIVSRNKLWTAHIARGMGVRAPRSWSAKALLDATELPCPVILKFNNEHASLGMTLKNLVRTRSELRARVAELGTYPAAVMAQEFIAGRELSVSMLGGHQSFPPRELRLGSEQDFVTEKVKFSAKHRLRRGIRAGFLAAEPKLLQGLAAASSRLFSTMGLSGYARFDFRLHRSGEFYLIDVNANPNLARDEDFAVSAARAGLRYDSLIARIVTLAKSYRPAT